MSHNLTGKADGLCPGYRSLGVCHLVIDQTVITILDKFLAPILTNPSGVKVISTVSAAALAAAFHHHRHHLLLPYHYLSSSSSSTSLSFS